MRRSAGLLRHLLWVPLAAVACGGRGAAPAGAPARAPAPARNSRSAPGRITDANTAALLLSTNNVALASARIAITRASRADVKALARRETAAHTALNTTLTHLLTRLEINPREEEVDRLLRDQSMARRDTLRNIAARRFDSAYVADEVRYHTEVLEAIDRVFLPSVRNAELRDYVVSLRPTIAAHLELAEQLQAALASRR
jgi:putative membrane protein